MNDETQSVSFVKEANKVTGHLIEIMREGDPAVALASKD
jgi:hypothetical protein